MSRYKNATMKTYTFGVDTVHTRKCDLYLDESGEIEVSYKSGTSEGGLISYAGMAQGEGHYWLESIMNGGRASLHRFPDSQILEGYWEVEEEKEKGMWRIELGKFANPVTGEKIPESDAPLVEEPDGLDEKLDDLFKRAKEEEVETEEDWGESSPRIYRFPLRHDWNVRLRLPDDLTRREGKRLASFVKSLSNEY